MQRSRRRFSLAVATVLTLTSALAIVSAPAAGANRGPDLSSRAAIEGYLISIGVDPSEAVWQEGLRNYAGASCPGVDWNCVPADVPIVQIAAPLGTNIFSCTGLDCVAVQVVPLGAGQNDAGCERGDKHADDVVQTCLIMQGNTSGNNNAVINQSIEQHGEEVTARQVARIEQTNESGKNLAGFRQVINQSSQVRGTVQSQEAHQAATLDQMSTTGDSTSNIDQHQNQSQRASGSSSITQSQNTDIGGTNSDFFCDQPGALPFDQDKNQCAELLQTSDPLAGGSLRSDLRQLIRESQTASGSPTVTQSQGEDTFLSGQGGMVNQSSSGVATSVADQDMVQSQTASGATTLSQTQHTGDPRCCQLQETNLNDSAEIDQTTNQSASSDDADQDATFSGTCVSTGSCHVMQSSTIDGTTDTNECTESPCFEFFVCAEEGEAGETVCTPSG